MSSLEERARELQGEPAGVILTALRAIRAEALEEAAAAIEREGTCEAPTHAEYEVLGNCLAAMRRLKERSDATQSG
jgi:hypothetical protein